MTDLNMSDDHLPDDADGAQAKHEADMRQCEAHERAKASMADLMTHDEIGLGQRLSEPDDYIVWLDQVCFQARILTEMQRWADNLQYVGGFKGMICEVQKATFHRLLELAVKELEATP